MKNLNIAKLLALPLVLGLTACGGGGGSGASLTPQEKTATLIFSTTSSAHSASLQGIQITAKLPQGVSIPNLGTALTVDNSIGQIVPGAYSAANQTVSFAVVPATQNNSIKFGVFAQLKCDVVTGNTLDQNSFTALNSPFTDLQMTGVADGSTVDLVPQIPVKVAVTSGF